MKSVKEQVLDVNPGAEAQFNNGCGLYQIIIELSAHTDSVQSAWQSALDRINKEKENE